MTICIYHSNCADGFGAAWVVRKALTNVEFYPGVYQSPPPDVRGKSVVMVDFSYKRPVIMQMAEEANEILIIDHHKSAAEDLIDLPGNVTTIFNMEHSGAVLTWHYFFPNDPPPELLLYIEDRDLWKFSLPNTREIQANLFSYPYDFEVWDSLMGFDPRDLIPGGKAIERKHLKDVKELLAVTQREMVIAGYTVPVANLPYTLVSEAAHKMAENKPFAACYWDVPNGRVFGLRSSAEGLDVSEIAKAYGGGGHRHAAGFKVNFDQVRDFGLQ